MGHTESVGQVRQFGRASVSTVRRGLVLSLPLPISFTRLARVAAALAVTALVTSGATLALVTPVHANSDGDLRLEDGSSDSEGRLEIFHDGEWGGVCNLGFRDVDAGVACRQMGYSSGSELQGLSKRYPLPVGKTFWLDGVDCNGSESRLEQCRHRGWGKNFCDENRAVSVSCEGDPPAPVETGGPPDEPAEPSLRALSTSSIEVLWTAPASSAAITGYGYRYRKRGSQREWTSATTAGTQATLTGLVTGTEYEVQVRAVSANGTGAWSSRSFRRTRRASAADCAGYSLRIPEQSDHPFHGKVITDSIPK